MEKGDYAEEVAALRRLLKEVRAGIVAARKNPPKFPPWQPPSWLAGTLPTESPQELFDQAVEASEQDCVTLDRLLARLEGIPGDKP